MRMRNELRSRIIGAGCVALAGIASLATSRTPPVKQAVFVPATVVLDARHPSSARRITLSVQEGAYVLSWRLATDVTLTPVSGPCSGGSGPAAPIVRLSSSPPAEAMDGGDTIAVTTESVH